MTVDAEAPEPDEPAPALAPVMSLISQHFSVATVTELRHTLQATVAAAGLIGETGYDFVLAVHELVTNAVRHGGGHGNLDLRRQDDVLICEITDYGGPADSLPMRAPAADVAGGRGLWLAHQLTDGLIITRRSDGVTATVTVCLEPLNRPDIQSAAEATQNGTLSSPGEDNER